MKFSLAAFLMFFICCSSEQKPGSTEDINTVHRTDAGIIAAEVNRNLITVRDLASFAEKSGRDRDEVLDGLINHYLLADKAREAGFSDSYEVYEIERRALAYRLIEKKVINPNLPEKISPDEIIKAYKEDKKYHQPRKRSVTHQMISARGKNKTKLFKKAGPLALKLAVDAEKVSTLEEFEQLAVKYRKTAEASRLYFRLEKIPEIEEGDKRYVPEFVENTFSIPGPGKTGGAVKTPYGWHVIFVYEEIPAVDIPLEKVREEIAKKLSEDRMTRTFDEFIASIEIDNSFRINEHVLLKEETEVNE